MNVTNLILTVPRRVARSLFVSFSTAVLRGPRLSTVAMAGAAALAASAGFCGRVAAQESAEFRSVVALPSTWSACHDATNVGFVQGFQAGGGAAAEWVPIEIPAAMEEHALFAGKNGAFWLKNKFTVPDLPAPGRRWRIVFDRVVENCTIWLNGTEVGAHACGDTPFFVDITNAAVPGENLLVVRLVDSIPGQTAEMMNVGGICGKVILQNAPAVTVEDLAAAFRPESAPGGTQLNIKCENSAPEPAEAQVKLEITEAGSQKVLTSASMNFTIAASSAMEASAIVNIPNPEMWSPESPKLYQASARLLVNGVPRDARKIQFGLRTAAINNDRIIINGNSVRIRGIVDIGYEPGTLLRPSALFEPARKVKLLKEAGFNVIFARGRQPLRELVEAANSQGMFIIEQPALLMPAVEWSHAVAGPWHLPFSLNYKINKNSARTAAILEEQVVRDRNEPSVLGWSLADAPGHLVRRVHALDSDAIVWRDAIYSGLNYYYDSASKGKVMYLRAAMTLPPLWGQVVRDRLLNFGDRGEFALVEVSSGAGISDYSRAINGLGGEMWREEARSYLSEMNEVAANHRLLQFSRWYANPESWIDAVQTLHADTMQQMVGTLRCNRALGGYVVKYVIDSPVTPGAGIFDTLGRPKREYVACARANLPRRYFVLPRQLAAEAPAPGMPVKPFEIDLAQVAETGAPLSFVSVEIARPDKVYGQTGAVKHPRWPWIQLIQIGCGAGEGKYTVNPVYKELKNPDIETCTILGVALPKIIFNDRIQNTSMADHVAVLASIENPWNERLFIEYIEALDIARAGGTVLLANALRPGIPLVDLEMIPGLTLGDGSNALHLALEEKVFAGLDQKGLVRAPVTGIQPYYCIATMPAGAQEYVIAVDEKGNRIGADIISVPYGRGKLILTTFPLAETALVDVCSRRVLSNLSEMAIATPPPAGGGTIGPNPDRAVWMQKFLAEMKKRGN